MLRNLSKYFLLWFERCAPQAGGCCRDPIFHLHEFTCPPGTFLSEWFFCSVIYDGTDMGLRFPQRWQLERNTTLKTRCFHQKALSFFSFKLLILCAVWNPWATFPDATGPMGTCAPLHLTFRWFCEWAAFISRSLWSLLSCVCTEQAIVYLNTCPPLIKAPFRVRIYTKLEAQFCVCTQSSCENVGCKGRADQSKVSMLTLNLLFKVFQSRFPWTEPAGSWSKNFNNHEMYVWYGKNRAHVENSVTYVIADNIWECWRRLSRIGMREWNKTWICLYFTRYLCFRWPLYDWRSLGFFFSTNIHFIRPIARITARTFLLFFSLVRYHTQTKLCCLSCHFMFIFLSTHHIIPHRIPLFVWIQAFGSRFSWNSIL